MLIFLFSFVWWAIRKFGAVQGSSSMAFCQALSYYEFVAHALGLKAAVVELALYDLSQGVAQWVPSSLLGNLDVGPWTTFGIGPTLKILLDTFGHIKHHMDMKGKKHTWKLFWTWTNRTSSWQVKGGYGYVQFSLFHSVLGVNDFCLFSVYWKVLSSRIEVAIRWMAFGIQAFEFLAKSSGQILR